MRRWLLAGSLGADQRVSRMWRWLLAGSLGAAVAGAAYKARTLTLDGAVAAAMVGSIAFARGGLPAAAALLAFFGSSSWLSRVGRRRKESLELAQSKGARRDAWQVIANGGIATLAIALRQPGAFVGALAAAGADTWATELGLLARRPPRLITTLRMVPRGTSGGVTPEGLAASLGGGLVVGLSWTAFTRHTWGPAVAVLAGTVAALVDSLLGATVQASYYCQRCRMPTEDRLHRPCGRRAQLSKGLPYVTNNTVNALATLIGAGVGLCAERQTRRSTSGEGASVSAASAGGRVCL